MGCDRSGKIDATRDRARYTVERAGAGRQGLDPGPVPREHVAMQVSVFMALSVDGFIARPDGDLGWLARVEAPGEDYGYSEFMADIDAVVMGRRTFEKVLGFGEWPFADVYVVVLSTSRPEALGQLPGQIAWMSGEPDEILKALERGGYRRIYLDGGETVRRFTAAGRVDRWILSRTPVLLGSGIPLFDSTLGEVELRHIHTRAFSSGLVQSEYETVRPGVGPRRASPRPSNGCDLNGPLGCPVGHPTPDLGPEMLLQAAEPSEPGP